MNTTSFSSLVANPNSVVHITEVVQLSGRVVIGNDSVLIFEGGKIVGDGQLKGTRTRIISAPIQIFDNITLEGTWSVPECYAEWWGAIGDGICNDAEALKKAIDFSSASGSILSLLPKVYQIGVNTIDIYTGTVIKGTLFGALDRSVFTGSAISYCGTGTAIRCVCKNEDTAKDTCFRFRLENFSILYGYIPEPETGWQTYYSTSNTATALHFLTERQQTAPRQGSVENIMIRGFCTGIKISAISYANFTNLNIQNCIESILIQKTNSTHCIEFARFNKIIVCGSYGRSSTGILVKDGNFLYFSQVDSNDCNCGLELQSNFGLFDIYIDKYHSLRCIKGLTIYAKNSNITRIFASDVSFHFSTDRNGEHVGLSFSRSQSYSISDCVFNRIEDSQSNSSSAGKTYRFLKTTSSGIINSCSFNDLRVLNPIEGLGNVKKISLTQAKSSGTVVIGPGQQSVTTEVFHKNIFLDSLSYFDVITSGSVIGVTSSLSVIDNKLKLTISVSSTSSSSRNITYLIPKLL